MKELAKTANKGTQRKAIKAGFSAVLCGVFLASLAHAQSVEKPQDIETPVAATQPLVPGTNTEVLPTNLQPEELANTSGTIINPKNVKSQKGAGRNRWNRATLTQTTGLSAASVNTPSPAMTAANDPLGSAAMATDLLTTEDLLSVGEVAFTPTAPILAAPPRSDGVINLSSSLRGALFDLATPDNVNASVFKLDMGERLCLGTAEDCRANDTQSIDVGYAKNITHGKLDGLNLQLSPRAGVRFDEESKSALVGALVRIGDNLREGSEMKSNTWYFFAGAEAEAVTYTPNSARRLTSGEFHLQNRIIVGDAQAGLGYRIGTADLALTYFKRQATAENYSYDEDAAALSITWKR